MIVTDRIADLSMIWKQACQVFPYFDQNNVDWDSSYRTYLPKVMAAESDRDFHLLLAEFMNLLGDGHTEYLFPRALQDKTGYLPFTLRYIGDSYCIDAAVGEFQKYVGGRLASINGVPFSDFIEKAKPYSYHVGNYITRYRLHQMLPFFLDDGENQCETSAGSFKFHLLSAKPENMIVQAINVPEGYQQLETGKLDIRLYNQGILYVKLNDFLYPKAVDEIRTAFTQIAEISGIIFDIRENVGGMTMHGAGIAELLISGVFHGCQKRTRSMTGIGLSSASQIIQWSDEDIQKHIASGYTTREEIEESKSFVTNTHFDRYIDSYGSEEHTALFAGPCVILTSRHTVSAAEDFLAMFRSNQRATIIGTETCGTTGTPLMQKLSCGGWLRICSVGYCLMDGTEFIGCGIKPDIFCETSVEAFQAGHDCVLDKGLKLLRQKGFIA